MSIAVHIPIKTVSEINLGHQHWAVRNRRAQTQRKAARTALEATGASKMEPPLTVWLTRVGKRKLDSDNLQGALKHIRDGVADWLGIDDGRDDLVRWEYVQSVGQHVGVHVTIEQERQMDFLKEAE